MRRALVLAVVAALGAGAWFATAPLRRGEPAPVVDPARMGADAALLERLRELTRDVDSDRGDAQAWARLARTYHVHEFFTEAAECYARALRESPGEAAWHWLRALALERAGRDDEAFAAAAEAATLAPGYAAIPATVATWHLARDRGDAALAEAERAAAAAPRDPGVWIVMASVRHGRGEDSLGEAAARRALGLPMDRRAQKSYAHFVLGTCLRSLGRPDEARVELSRGRDGDGRFPIADPWREELATHVVSTTLLAHAAHADVLAGRYDEVLPFLLELRSRDPDHPQVLADLGRVCRETGRLDDALAVLSHGVTRHPRLPTMWAELALTHERRLDPMAAEDAIRRGLDATPGSGELLETRGLMHLRIGRRAEAVADFVRAFEAEPSHAWVLVHAGVAELEAGDTDAAERHLQRCVEREPGLADAHAGLAIVAARRGDVAGADARLAVARRLDDGTASLLEAAESEIAAARGR